MNHIHFLKTSKINCGTKAKESELWPRRVCVCTRNEQDKSVPLLSASWLTGLLLLRVFKNFLENGFIFLKNYSRDSEVSFQSLSTFSEMLG